MGRTACTDPQCLHKGALHLLPSFCKNKSAKNSHTLSYSRNAFLNQFFLLLIAHFIACVVQTEEHINLYINSGLCTQLHSGRVQTRYCPSCSAGPTRPTPHVRHSVPSVPVDRHVSTSIACPLLAVAAK